MSVRIRLGRKNENISVPGDSRLIPRMFVDRTECRWFSGLDTRQLSRTSMVEDSADNRAMRVQFSPRQPKKALL